MGYDTDRFNMDRFKCDPCPDCINPADGESIYPWYGVAPHAHVGENMIGSTRILPKNEWPENFLEDSDCKGMGTYTHCLTCKGTERAKL